MKIYTFLVIFILKMHRKAGPLEMNTNAEIEKDPQTTGQTDGQKYYTATQGI